MKPKATADGIPVYCDHSAIVDIETVVPNPKNDNSHSEYQIDLLSRFIKHRGWRAPITISNRSGFIVRGEGRYLAARHAGWREVPVDYQDYLNEAEELADLKADNRINDFSRPDPEKEKGLLSDLLEQGYDMDIVGYTPDDLAALLEEVDLDKFFESSITSPPPERDTIDPTTPKTIVCPLCGGSFLESDRPSGSRQTTQQMPVGGTDEPGAAPQK